MRVEFINSAGGIMLVDESRVEEYKAAGYMLAANIIDSTARVIEEPAEEKKRTTKRRKED